MTSSRAPQEAAVRAPSDWLLTAAERGNDASRLPSWTAGNAVRPLVDGRTYFRAVADVLQDTGNGDLVLFTDWRGDPDELLTDHGPTIAEALSQAAGRGVLVKGLVWRSPLDLVLFSPGRNRNLSRHVTGGGAQVLLDQRVRPRGSHHQKSFVIRHAHRSQDDVAFVGDLDFGHSRRDDTAHRGDPQTMPFGRRFGPRPSWHDTHAEIRGPAVHDVETVFRERWEDPNPLSLLPWQLLPDLLRRVTRQPSRLPPQLPAPAPAGSCTVQLLRTYPARWPRYPFAPTGERSVARGHAKALGRARRLVYVEEQYLWSTDIAQVFADALLASPRLHLVLVLPRAPERDYALAVPPLVVGQLRALEVIRAAGGDRVHVFDLENHQSEPVYVHAKISIVDDVWACVRSDNLNLRSWTHDSELSAAVLDDTRDGREPTDPAGLGDGARRFARGLRLQLMREHLDRDDLDDADLLDPDSAVEALRASAAALEAWHQGGRRGARPPGRLRPHAPPSLSRWQQRLSEPVYRLVLDPDARPRWMRRQRSF